jgi:uncharacterized radical SAM protein YgiQ
LKKSRGFETNSGFLPVSLADMEARGWEACDFIFVSGDAYIDHPSFAGALICRVLEAEGFRAGIIPQPDWKDPSSYTVLGRPRLAFLVGAGNMDSMVAHYTSAKRLRSEDAYSPGGKGGRRPDRALLRYTEGIRAAYKGVPVIIGGLEAGLRRFAHYDYWSDTVRRSVLLDSKADLLVYGMGENAILEIARRLDRGESVKTIADVRGTCVRAAACPEKALRLPPYETVKGNDEESLKAYAEHFILQKANTGPASGKMLAEFNDGGRWVVQNPPAFLLGQKELDRIYELPFTRRTHPMYAEPVPALTEVRFSLVSSRGCFGGCSFCAITFHQGRAVQSRSRESLVREAETLAKMPEFKGYIHDVGGPTANFYRSCCEKQKKGDFCPHRECLFPKACPNVKADHRQYMETLAAIRQVRGVKKVFIRSGIRYDFIKLDKTAGGEFLETLCMHHVSGQLKVAPEHIAPAVLAAMGKTGGYEDFSRQYAETNKKLALKQYLIPYFISGHPGCTLKDAAELALFLKKNRFVPDQVQDFYPTPGTLSTVMYHTGLDPRTMEPVHVPGGREKRIQRALLQFNKAENRNLAYTGLKEAGREDLIAVLGLNGSSADKKKP